MKHDHRSKRSDREPQSNHDKLQRALNDSKRQRIAERFGAKFSPPHPDMPLDVEAEWLDNIERFEEAALSAERIRIREFLGNPAFLDSKDLSPEQLSQEIEVVIALLEDNNIRVDCLSDDVSDEDFYKFLTTELMDQEIEDLRLEGFTACFIYEEFHPNNRMDIEELSRDFFWRLFRRDVRFIDFLFAKKGMRDPDGRPITQDAAIEQMKQWINSIAVFTTHTTAVRQCDINGDSAVLTVDTSWTGLDATSLAERSASGESIFKVQRLNGHWWIVQMTIAGFEWRERKSSK